MNFDNALLNNNNKIEGQYKTRYLEARKEYNGKMESALTDNYSEFKESKCSRVFK